MACCIDKANDLNRGWNVSLFTRYTQRRFKRPFEYSDEGTVLIGGTTSLGDNDNDKDKIKKEMLQHRLLPDCKFTFQRSETIRLPYPPSGAKGLMHHGSVFGVVRGDSCVIRF